MRSRWKSAEGAVAPALMLVMFALVAAGLFFLRQAAAAGLAAEGDSAADAAALAGADAVRMRLDRTDGVAVVATLLATGALPPSLETAASAVATDYAGRNGGRLVSARLTKVGGSDAIRFEVTVQTTRSLDGEVPTRTAAAELRFVLTTSTGRCLSQSEVDDLLFAAGVAATHNGRSGLVACNGTDTENLDVGLRLAFLRAEATLKQRESDDGAIIALTSAYRSAAQQAQLYTAYQACLAAGSVRCVPAAAPGASLHNFGRAIDVPEWFSARLQAVLQANPRTGLCFPDIPNDPYHFQDCRGRPSGGPGGAAFGQLELDRVRLVR